MHFILFCYLLVPQHREWSLTEQAEGAEEADDDGEQNSQRKADGEHAGLKRPGHILQDKPQHRPREQAR